MELSSHTLRKEWRILGRMTPADARRTGVEMTQIHCGHSGLGEGSRSGRMVADSGGWKLQLAADSGNVVVTYHRHPFFFSHTLINPNRDSDPNSIKMKFIGTFLMNFWHQNIFRKPNFEHFNTKFWSYNYNFGHFITKFWSYYSNLVTLISKFGNFKMLYHWKTKYWSLYYQILVLLS